MIEVDRTWGMRTANDAWRCLIDFPREKEEGKEMRTAHVKSVLGSPSGVRKKVW